MITALHSKFKDRIGLLAIAYFNLGCECEHLNLLEEDVEHEVVVKVGEETVLLDHSDGLAAPQLLLDAHDFVEVSFAVLLVQAHEGELSRDSVLGTILDPVPVLVDVVIVWQEVSVDARPDLEVRLGGLNRSSPKGSERHVGRPCDRTKGPRKEGAPRTAE